MYRLHSLNNNENYWNKVYISYVNSVVQGIEYSVSSFTISDGAFGTCFFFGTGFLLSVALYKYIYFNKIKTYAQNFKFNNNLRINTTPTNKLFYPVRQSSALRALRFEWRRAFSNCNSQLKTLPDLKREFLEWLVGFTDGEGNFNIKITGLNNKTFKNVQFTFQIGIHKDEIEVLEYIKNNLKCGHISKSKDRINYFVNDQNSLIHIILPIFETVNLNSSKYHHFLLFKKAVMLTKNKEHLLDKGKLEIIKYQKEMKNMSGKWIPSSNKNINVTKHWLAGCVDAEGTFSTNKYVPRFKLENHVKELELYNKIKEFIGVGNVLLTLPRENRVNSNPTIVLEINKIKQLIDNFIPLIYDENKVLLKSLKSKDFFLWLKLIDLYYKGYHTIPGGKDIFDAIKLHMNKYRLTTNTHLLSHVKLITISEIDNLLSKLYLLESPYEIKQGFRYYRNTKKLISESTKIIVINKGKSNVYNSLSECAKNLSISRKKIKECLSSGISYKGYSFVLN